MDEVIIKPEGFYKYFWDRDKQIHVTERVEGDEILRYLNSTCTIENATLKDIFDAVETSPLLTSFLGLSCRCDMSAFHEEAKLPPEPLENVAALEIYHSIGIEYYEFDYTDVPTDKKEIRWKKTPKENPYYELDKRVCFHGLSSEGKREGASEGSEQDHFGVDFLPVHRIVGYPVVLRPSVEIWKERLGRKQERLPEARAFYTLHEVLTAIYSEISFYGPPSRRDSKSAKLDQLRAETEETGYEGFPLVIEE